MFLDCEHQQKCHEEREDPQRFGECQADEQCGCLTSSSGWVAQCASQVVSCNCTNTDCGSAGTNCSQTSADVCEFAFNVYSPYDWKLDSKTGHPVVVSVRGEARLSGRRTSE